MPHDKHGNMIEVGDAIRVSGRGLGLVTSVQEHASSCNVVATLNALQPLVGQYLNANEVEIVAKGKSE